MEGSDWSQDLPWPQELGQLHSADTENRWVSPKETELPPWRE